MREFFKGWRRKAALLVLAAVLIVGLGGFFALRCVENEYRNYSALCTVEVLIKDHLSKAPVPHFPSSWEDLANDDEGHGTSIFTLKELTERVVVNWEVGSRCLETANATAPDEAQTLRVISLPDGSRGRWHGDDPNRNLVGYILELGRKLRKPSTLEPEMKPN